MLDGAVLVLCGVGGVQVTRGCGRERVDSRGKGRGNVKLLLFFKIMINGFKLACQVSDGEGKICLTIASHPLA